MNFVEMKKLDDFFKFKRLLKEFVRNPKQYDRIVIRTDFVGAKRGYCTRKMFDGSEAIREHCDDSDVDNKKIISVFCFKN